jgi:hypothetical protein
MTNANYIDQSKLTMIAPELPCIGVCLLTLLVFFFGDLLPWYIPAIFLIGWLLAILATIFALIYHVCWMNRILI